MYRDGLGAGQDYAEAMEMFLMAAEDGNADAERNIGGMYLSGQGVGKDPAEAMKWIRRASEHDGLE